MYRTILLFAALFTTTAASAQRMLLVQEGSTDHLVRQVTEEHLFYQAEGRLARVAIADAETRVVPIDTLKPGYIWLLSGEFEQVEAPDGRIRVQLDTRIMATRNLHDVALVVTLSGASTATTVITHPVGTLTRNEEEVISFAFDLLAENEGLVLDSFFISGGLEVRSGEQRRVPQTPYDYYLKDVAQGRPQDGEIAVMRSRKPALVRDNLGSPLNGKVVLNVSVNEAGFVTDAEAIEYDDWRLAESALRSIYLWHFKPAIEAGKPVAAKVRLPFVF